jgi:hypothetical protein
MVKHPVGDELDVWIQSVAYPALGEIRSRPDYAIWLQEVFDDAGPVDEDRLLVLRLRRRLGLTRLAVALLREDVSVGLEPVPGIEVEVSGNAVEVSCDGESSPNYPGGILGVTSDIVTLETADCVQDGLILGRHVTWPLCPRPEHRSPLDPQLRNGVPVWQCNGGKHVVCDIGKLAT